MPPAIFSYKSGHPISWDHADHPQRSAKLIYGEQQVLKHESYDPRFIGKWMCKEGCRFVPGSRLPTALMMLVPNSAGQVYSQVALGAPERPGMNGEKKLTNGPLNIASQVRHEENYFSGAGEGKHQWGWGREATVRPPRLKSGP